MVSAGPGKLEQTTPWIRQSEVGKHRRFSSAELNTQGKALPLYHLRCRGMTSAYLGDPGKPGECLRGGGDSRRRAELERLYPAEIEERIRGIQSGADWAEGQLERHYEKHGNDFATLDEYSEAVSQTIANPSRIVSKYYTQGGQEYCQWGLYSEETGLLVNVYQHNGHIGTAFPSRAWRRDGYTRPDMVEVTDG